jgi:ubiquinone/menaquinone biosynthesis C-methylase UbiE
MDYNQAAGDYAIHRRIHTGVLRELCQEAQLATESTVLEVGCGTGNYAMALGRHFGCTVLGLDPSVGMLAQAPRDGGAWLLGRAEQLPFVDSGLDLIFCVDVIHHVTDRAAYYGQAARTLRPSGRVCTVTDSEEIIRRREILSVYFPETVERELARYPSLAQLEEWMAGTGLVGFRIVTVEQAFKLSNAQPFRDRAFSSLHLISEEAWRSGLEHLERDLAKAPILGASRYTCIWGRKRSRPLPPPSSRSRTRFARASALHPSSSKRTVFG